LSGPRFYPNIMEKRKGQKKNLFREVKYFSWFLVFLWTGCIAASLLWNIHGQKEKILDIAFNSAHLTYKRDVLYRKWATKQGGVYVPISMHTPPNPYLQVLNRDIRTPSGLALTLVNPAYMARQVNQIAADIQADQTHLTSLKPIRPDNRPDPWEETALKSFERGVKEVSSVEKIDGQEFLRLMHPFIVEKDCLKCHSFQGYKVGDIRGGISVTTPMKQYYAIEKPYIVRISIAHLLLWLTGFTGIMISKKRLDKQISARDIAEAKEIESAKQHTLELQSLSETLEERVKERTTELADLSSQLVSAQEKERKRVSYELHDQVWQNLVAIRFAVENLFSDRENWTTLKLRSEEVIRDLQDTVRKIQSMQGDLWPYVLDDIGVVATIDWYCREFEKNHQGIVVETKCSIKETEIPPAAKIVIYRILQETMSNVSKHSNASRVTICLFGKDRGVEFTVEDNGVGFNLEEVIARRSPWGGGGLLTIKGRTELSNGTFEVESIEGRGTIVRASWPI
jgi:signal transduction histidine kinase